MEEWEYIHNNIVIIRYDIVVSYEPAADVPEDHSHCLHSLGAWSVFSLYGRLIQKKIILRSIPNVFSAKEILVLFAGFSRMHSATVSRP